MSLTRDTKERTTKLKWQNGLGTAVFILTTIGMTGFFANQITLAMLDAGVYGPLCPHKPITSLTSPPVPPNSSYDISGAIFPIPPTGPIEYGPYKSCMPVNSEFLTGDETDSYRPVDADGNMLVDYKVRFACPPSTPEEVGFKLWRYNFVSLYQGPGLLMWTAAMPFEKDAQQ
jgi:hypothetical protein